MEINVAVTKGLGLWQEAAPPTQGNKWRSWAQDLFFTSGLKTGL